MANKARNAAKWSLTTEAIAKLIMPITQLVLARLLAPEAFGVLATVIMISSFAEMLSDAGFRNYLIQHEFADDQELHRAANVAFWTSLAVALALLTGITVARDEIASMVGNPGLGTAIAVASCSIPIATLTTAPMAIFRRDFEYKKLLPIRLLVATVPLVVSVPLALAGCGYWSLILGVLASGAVNAVSVTAISSWKPRAFYSFGLLRQMFSFSAWSLLEAVSIWASLWAGTFIAARVLTPHELGLYREPMLVVNSAFALITTATTPILFAALSRLQTDRDQYRRFFFQFQFSVALAILPVGIGTFFYRDFFTSLLFGSQWAEAAINFGAWAFSTSFAIVFSHYCSEIFRSLGKPRISFLSQCLYMAIMIPSLYYAAHESYGMLVVVSAAIRVVQIVINQVLTYLVAGIGTLQVLRNLCAPLLSTALMGGFAAWSSTIVGDNWGWSFLGVLMCAVIYGSSILCFPRSRALVMRALSPIWGQPA